MFVAPETFARPLLDGLEEKLQLAVAERIKRLGQLGKKMKKSGTARARELAANWLQLKALFSSLDGRSGDGALRDAFLEKVEVVRTANSNDYLATIKGLGDNDAELGTRWLQGIVDEVREAALEIVPSFE
jgi:hypothetical protein